VVDLHHEPRLTVGATPLVARCIREEGWSEPYARRVLRAYLQWLHLKAALQDWDATLLSPSIPVDRMWHHHILDVSNYHSSCLLLCGRVVDHDPDGGLDLRARNVRLRMTRDALLSNYPGSGEIDEEIWRDVLQVWRPDNRKRQRSDGVQSGALSIFVRTIENKKFALFVDPSETIEDVMVRMRAHVDEARLPRASSRAHRRRSPRR